jgi:hypothetical protein
MSTDREVTRIVRSWLDEGVTTLPDRVLDAVLDQIPATPQRRAWWPARRRPTLHTYARFGLAAAAFVMVAVAGIGIYANTVGRSSVPTHSSAPSRSPTPASASNPLVGTWLAPQLTCAQQMATVKAAGFTTKQITRSGWGDCSDGGTMRYSIRYGEPGISDVRSYFAYDDGAPMHSGHYRLIDDSTLEDSQVDGEVCVTIRYVIDGDRLTLDIIDFGCPGAGPAPLLDQVALTAIYETSSFVRQP